MGAIRAYCLSPDVKILLIHNLQFGGAHRRITEQLAHIDHPVTEVTFSTAEPITAHPIVVPITYRDWAPSRLVRPATRYLDLVSLLAAYRRFDAVASALSPDVVWMNHCQILHSMALPEELARRTVYLCDEPRRIDYEPELRTARRTATLLPYWPIRQTTRHLDRTTVSRVARIGTNSSFAVRAIERAYGRSATVVRCGVSPTFRPTNGPRSRDFLLSVGNLISIKGHDLAIRAAGRSGLRLPLVVVSHRSDPPEEARLRAEADRAGVDLIVKIGVTDEELVALYQQARVTLYLSLAEPFGLVSLEAQACGCPVIVSDEGGLPETIVRGVTGWAVPRTPAAAGTRLAEFADDAVVDRFGSAAAEHTAGWSWADSARHLTSLMAEVAGA